MKDRLDFQTKLGISRKTVKFKKHLKFNFLLI